MKSIAFQHFPRVVEEAGNRLLFNPVLKKRAKNRPEERVRLRWVEYLLHQTKVKKSRIGFEAPVRLKQEPNKVRADLVLYSDDLSPEILIECKAETIPLTAATAEQAARYNTELKASMICLTNGVSDYWFKTDGSRSESPIAETAPFAEAATSHSWWSERGFGSSSDSAVIKEQLPGLLIRLFSAQDHAEVRYLGFERNPFNLPMNHYYRLVKADHAKLAVSVTGSSSHGATLVAVLNRNGQNAGLMAAGLTDVMENGNEAVRVVTAGGKKQKSGGELFEVLTGGGELTSESLVELMLPFFD